MWRKSWIWKWNYPSWVQREVEESTTSNDWRWCDLKIIIWLLHTLFQGLSMAWCKLQLILLFWLHKLSWATWKNNSKKVIITQHKHQRNKGFQRCRSSLSGFRVEKISWSIFFLCPNNLPIKIVKAMMNFNFVCWAFEARNTRHPKREREAHKMEKGGKLSSFFNVNDFENFTRNFPHTRTAFFSSSWLRGSVKMSGKKSQTKSGYHFLTFSTDNFCRPFLQGSMERSSSLFYSF